MALEAPLRSAAGNTMSAFSPLTDIVSSPDSPARSQQYRPLKSSAVISDTQSLRPASMPAGSVIARPSSANFLMSPSDVPGPSPATSNGTETTEIEDEMSEESSTHPSAANPVQQPQLMMLRTNLPDSVRQAGSEEAVSVIHAPESFKSWSQESNDSTIDANENDTRSVNSRMSSPKTSPRPDNIQIPSPGHNEKSRSPGMPTPPPIYTDVRPVKFNVDQATPRAQDLQEVQDFIPDSSRIRSSSASSLELIPEVETDAEADADGESDVFASPSRHREEPEKEDYNVLLQETWTLCNSFGRRFSNRGGTPNAHDWAWKCCWKLCQRLYNNQYEDALSFDVRGNLDLCRDFCQSLFDLRPRHDEVADSVLRVSFELNNHLYSAQDSRNLPEAFRERTLEFYITLCHRLMKQRQEVAVETDSLNLLRACWSLAEILFSLRENRRRGKATDDELLGSAIQACWELCDIFREGLSLGPRADRTTPRPSQMNFFNQPPAPSTQGEPTPRAISKDYATMSNAGSTRSRRSQRRDGDRNANDDKRSTRSETGSTHSHHTARKANPPQPVVPPVPETPVTEFEDTPVSPDSESPVPNILVLGTINAESNRGGRWSSSASQLSTYSQSSARTSSTATTATAAEDINITRIKILILKAAMNIGFTRDGDGRDRDTHSQGKGSKGVKGLGSASLASFVKGLPTGSFGSLPAHAALLTSYRNLVLADHSFRTSSSLPSRGKKVYAHDVANSIGWLMLRSGQYSFLRDLFRVVFGFHAEEAEQKKGVSITV